MAALVTAIERLEAAVQSQTQLIAKLIEQNIALVAGLAPAPSVPGQKVQETANCSARSA